jgi:hypothetical protein
MAIAIHREMRALVSVLGAVFIGCGTTSTNAYVAAGGFPLCAPQSIGLGVVAVLPETAWRSNQKDPAARLAMAGRALARVFAAIPCGSLEPPGGVRPFAPWSPSPEEDVLQPLSEAGVETAILLRIEELTPQILVTLSLPFLWFGASEADFRIRVVHLPDRSVRLDARIKRSTGGPFQLRPAAWSEEELVRALEEVMAGGG